MFLSGSAQAATTISTTLTMTSPSAIISMTGVSATAYLSNISATNISATAGIGITKCVTSGDMTVPAAYALTAFTHNLGRTPTSWNTWLRNTTPEQGYAVGDVVDTTASNGTTTANFGFNVVQNATSTTVVWGGNIISILSKGAGAQAKITNGDWVFVVRDCI